MQDLGFRVCGSGRSLRLSLSPRRDTAYDRQQPRRLHESTGWNQGLTCDSRNSAACGTTNFAWEAWGGKMETGKENPYSCVVLAGMRNQEPFYGVLA